jgi:hypothetical protein
MRRRRGGREDALEATRKASRGRDMLAVEWVAIPGAVAVVVAVGFALRFVLG